MSTIRVSTALAVAAAMALSAFPVQAQEAAGDADRPRAERRRPRDTSDGPRNDGRQAQAERRRRIDAPPSAGPRAEAVPRAERGPRPENRDANGGGRQDRGRDLGRDRDRDRDRDWDRGRDRDWDRDGNRDRRIAPPRGARDGWRVDRGRDQYRYRPAPRVYRNYNRPARVWTVPYGYRPLGYRRGWNASLYFGRPFGYGPGVYGSRSYGASGYGYYSLPPGFAYGSVRIVDAPRFAPVFVDGYYAGEVDDYDGIFQRLNLEPGRHLIEIDAYPGAPPLDYEVYVEPGRTVTIHVRP